MPRTPLAKPSAAPNRTGTPREILMSIARTGSAHDAVMALRELVRLDRAEERARRSEEAWRRKHALRLARLRGGAA